MIAGAAVTAGMESGEMLVSDAMQGKVSGWEDYALYVASAELMFFTNPAGPQEGKGNFAKAAGRTAVTVVVCASMGPPSPYKLVQEALRRILEAVRKIIKKRGCRC